MTDLHFDDYKTRMHNAGLRDIQGHAEGIRFNSMQIISSPYQLEWREPFATSMERAMEDAIAAARHAQTTLEKKLAEYRALKTREAA